MSSHSGGILLSLVVAAPAWQNWECGKIPPLVSLGFAGERRESMEMDGRRTHGVAGGSWKRENGGKEGKIGIFFYSSRGSSGSAGKRRKEIPPGIHQQEGIPALQPRVGGGSTSVWKTEENPAGVEETHGKSCRNGAGLFGKGKIWDERWHLRPVGPRLAKIHWLHPMEWE